MQTIHSNAALDSDGNRHHTANRFDNRSHLLGMKHENSAKLMGLHITLTI